MLPSRSQTLLNLLRFISCSCSVFLSSWRSHHHSPKTRNLDPYRRIRINLPFYSLIIFFILLRFISRQYNPLFFSLKFFFPSYPSTIILNWNFRIIYRILAWSSLIYKLINFYKFFPLYTCWKVWGYCHHRLSFYFSWVRSRNQENSWILVRNFFDILKKVVVCSRKEEVLQWLSKS